MHLLLGALGLAPAASCGGTSVQHPGAGGSTAMPSFAACENPSTVGDTGWIQCDNGALHRERAGECALPDPSRSGSDACGECSGISNGWCLPTDRLMEECVQGCTTDAECDSGEVCYCDPLGGRCIPSDCSTDADCGDGSLCATYEGPPAPACGYYVSGVACQTTADRCAGAECNCAMVNGRRDCVMGLGGCGRPFLVDGLPRQARIEARSDWAAHVAPAHLSALSADERHALAESFTTIALMEHASIAAFARFTLELLALGAPADLVQGAAEAMADEKHHTELAFGLASTYAGRPLGPSPLALDGALEPPSLESVLWNVLLEGCIGETVAAAEAQELARYAEDPTLREVFALIARDEARHAALAYRFVGWAFARDRDLAERVVRALLSRELASHRVAPAVTPDDDRRLALGMATPALQASLRRDALEQVVRPCLSALLDARATTPRAA